MENNKLARPNSEQRARTCAKYPKRLAATCAKYPDRRRVCARALSTLSLLASRALSSRPSQAVRAACLKYPPPFRKHLPALCFSSPKSEVARRSRGRSSLADNACWFRGVRDLCAQSNQARRTCQRFGLWAGADSFPSAFHGTAVCHTVRPKRSSCAHVRLERGFQWLFAHSVGQVRPSAHQDN